jgi:hypothetical protein
VRLVIIGIIVIIVPFFTLLSFEALMLMTSIFDLAACISAADDVAQISVIPVSSLATFFRWSETACQVPMRTLPVVRLVTSCFVITIKRRVNHGCYVQHRLEVFHICVNFFIVFWQVGGELIDEHP